MSIFAFDPKAAEEAGSSNFIQDGGAYVFKITEVKIEHGQNGSQSAALEFTLDAPEGAANWVRVNYQKRDGTVSPFGYRLLCAMAALIGARNGNPPRAGQDLDLHHFQDQTIGLVLQKVLTSKQDGTDSYKFEVLRAFDPATRKTWSEAKNKQEATAIAKVLEGLTVRDDRQRQQQQRQQGAGSWGQPQQATSHPQQTSNGHQQGYNNPPMDFDDDIPF